ncbi:hypothetical protein KC355_g19199, partial [Hortaea werneckii]
MSKEPRSIVVTAQLKRTSYRGVIDVVYGGEKPAPVEKKQNEQKTGSAKGQAKAGNAQKRKAEGMSAENNTGEAAEKPISKREAKRRAKDVRASGNSNQEETRAVDGV